ncbi:MAG: DUF3488 and transglutaminase-like domain-containing protein [Candidatus Accumulibacter sp.]|jgi:transglutaminase-like putative cysteine protease|nr:DUF3488 and transglutaminase-like domain-containing protein [Accumulibacter sp.]
MMLEEFARLEKRLNVDTREWKTALSRFLARPPSSSPNSLHDEFPWIFAVIAATAAPHVSHLSPWLSLFCGFVLFGRALLWKSKRAVPRGLPTLFALFGTVGIALEYRSLLGRDPGVALLFLFIALKSAEMRSRRDFIFIIMLGFFLLLTHYFYSQSIITGIWLLISLWILIATLLRLHGEKRPVRQTFGYAGVLFAQSFPLMLILFLLFPRVQGPLWGLPRDAHAGLSGLSDTLSPGSLDELIQSGAIAFRAKFENDEIPAKSDLYWRGPVFTDYDGQTWRARPFYLLGRAEMPAIDPGQKVYRYTTTLEPHNLRWILPLDLPVFAPENSLLTSTFETIVRIRVGVRTQYHFGSAPGNTIETKENQLLLQEALMLPNNANPRARAFAARLKEGFDSPERFSSAVLLHFREEEFIYTLQPPLLPERDSIDQFLFETRQGFCEHYASAYVFLMRAAGVPARVIAGYQGGEINPIDGYLTVRQSDAHAWAEIWLEGKGWRRIDPTAYIAPSRIEQGITAALPSVDTLPVFARLDSNWLRDLRNRWEATNNAWNQWILGYNPELQREVLSRIGLNDPNWRNMLTSLGVLCGVVFALVSLWTFRHRQKESPAQRAWRLFCDKLARRGLRRLSWEGPFTFAERAGRSQPEIGAIAREAALCYARLHYGTGGPKLLERLKSCSARILR